MVYDKVIVKWRRNFLTLLCEYLKQEKLVGPLVGAVVAEMCS